MPDPVFADPHLAGVYDRVDDDRSDLAAYVALAEELGARRVVDVGCGTGSLAVLLADRGLEVVGVDPAAASLAVAREKPGADRVRWIEGDATALPALGADLAVMTGNVAQVFLTDEDWGAALGAVHGVLQPGGWLAFETRVPERRAWRRWTPEHTLRTVVLADGGEMETWTELLSEDLPLVSFRHTYRFPDGTVRTSTSTLRFRSRAELDASLAAAGLIVVEVRDAPDRPGMEWVYLARR